jgi:hypothetical protein
MVLGMFHIFIYLGCRKCDFLYDTCLVYRHVFIILKCLMLWHVSLCRFRTCLKMADTGPANLIGKLFFNIVQTKCFVLKPQKLCVKRSWWGKCLKHQYRKQAYLRDNIPYWGIAVIQHAFLLIEFHWRKWSSVRSDAGHSGPTSYQRKSSSSSHCHHDAKLS